MGIIKIMEQKEFYAGLRDALESPESTDVLPFLREHIKFMNSRMDQLLEKDLVTKAWLESYLGVKVVHFQLDDRYLPIPSDGEPDVVWISTNFEWDKNPKWTDYLDILAIILVSDCSNCCNALDYIRVSKYGIIATGNVTRTYHS